MTKHRLRIGALLLGLSFSSALSDAQDLSFDVSSVRANPSVDQSSSINTPPGGNFSATNMPLRTLIRFAYGVQSFAIVGAPEWTAAQRFDIVAKAARPDVSDDQLRRMLQHLLQERFALQAHLEIREMTVYALVLARAEGPSSAQLRRSDTDCAAVGKARRSNGTPTPAPAIAGKVLCSMRSARGSLNGSDQPLSTLTEVLTPTVQRTVVDRTGLTGAWDFELKWTPDPPAGAPPSADADGPSIFTALPEQLGLKLEPGRGSVEVLVIDSVERLRAD
jgi:uncharacterized protein (TIGR03435 family)